MTQRVVVGAVGFSSEQGTRWHVVSGGAAVLRESVALRDASTFAGLDRSISVRTHTVGGRMVLDEAGAACVPAASAAR